MFARHGIPEVVASEYLHTFLQSNSWLANSLVFIMQPCSMSAVHTAQSTGQLSRADGTNHEQDDSEVK